MSRLTRLSKIGTLLLGSMFVLAGVALAAQITTSWQGLRGKAQYQEIQMLRCDVSGGLTDTDPQIGGEACATNDWSQAVDARWATAMTLYVFEYGTGSIDVTLWDCIDPTQPGAITGVGLPGVETPGATPGPSDPDPLCVDLTAGAGVTIIGTSAGTQKFSLWDERFNHLVARIDDCTANCDAMIYLTLGKN